MPMVHWQYCRRHEKNGMVPYVKFFVHVACIDIMHAINICLDYNICLHFCVISQMQVKVARVTQALFKEGSGNIALTADGGIDKRV